MAETRLHVGLVVSDDIDYGNYPIQKGNIIVSDAPGFGMKLLK